MFYFFNILVVFKIVNKVMRKEKKEEKPTEPPKRPDDIVLLEEIRDLLKEQNKNTKKTTK